MPVRTASRQATTTRWLFTGTGRPRATEPTRRLARPPQRVGVQTRGDIGATQPRQAWAWRFTAVSRMFID
jgi:hypothetical protein